MYELICVCGNTYYVDCPSKIGLVKVNDTEVCLIDSGNDKNAAKKVLRHIQANGWTLKAIYNTHFHADHIGGNQYLQEQTACRIFAPAVECDFTNHPLLEPMVLYGGYPCHDLRGKFLLAKESAAEELTAEVLPDGWEILPLPGHSVNMVGFRTADDVVFLADCLSGETTLAKYRIGVVYDPTAYVQTLETVKHLHAAAFVPSHAPVTNDIVPLAQHNIDTVLDIRTDILMLCREAISFEALLTALFDRYELTMTIEQYVLVGSTVRSYLAVLKDEGCIQCVILQNQLLWQTAV